MVVNADPATVQLSVSNSTIDFGSVALNATSIKTLTLTSSGTAAITVNSVTLAGAAFSLSGISLPATLNPGQTVTIQIAFNPTVAGLATGTVTISSDSASSSTGKVTLTGTGAPSQAPQMTVSANNLDFGHVNLNTTSAQTLTLTSSGTAALTVNSVTLTGAGFAISGAAFPATLNPGESLALQLTFDPTAIGAVIGIVAISSDSASGNTNTVNLAGTGMAAQMTLSAINLDFGNVNLDTKSTKSLTLTSSGNTALAVNSVTVTGATFAISGATFPTALNPGQSLILEVGFDPTVAGAATGTITISSDARSGGTSTVTLSGTGTAAQLMPSTSSLDFGNIALNTTSTKNLILNSSGNAAVTVNSVMLTGGAFAISGGTFPATLNPGQSLTLQVSFDPTVTGAATGTLTISSSSTSGGTSTVNLTGTGTSAQLTVSASTLDFGNVNLDATSTKTLTLTSSGNTAVTINSVTLTAAAFAISGATFPATLNPGQSLTLQVNFDPTTAGDTTGTIAISSNSSIGAASTVRLTGTGKASRLSVSSAALDFGNVNLNTTSTQTLTLTSSGNAALTVNSVTVAGAAFAISGATFPVTLNPGQSIAFQVSFDPTVSGAVAGTVSISTNSRSNPTSTVSLTGTGTATQLTLSSSRIDFGSVNLNSSSTKTLTLTSSGNAAVTVHAVVLSSGAFGISGATFPATLNPGQSLALQVSFNPSVTGAVTATATISSNSSTGGSSTVALTGTGIAAELAMSAASFDFGNIALNTTSTKTLTLTSSGNASVTVSSVALAGPAFAVSGATLPATLSPGQSLSLQVSFDPTATGVATGTITISSNSSSGSTSTVNLTGTGTAAQLTLSSSTIDFGSINLNTTSTKTLTLTSSGNAALTVNSVTSTGAAFAITGATFPATLNPGQSIALNVSFDPTTTGAATGAITISSNSTSGGSSTVTLAGTGTAAQLTINSYSLDFGNVNLSATSTRTLGMTASGNTAVTVSSVTVTGAAFSISGATFPATLSPGQTMTLQVSFAPAVTGAATGTITISSNSSSGATATVSLSGTGTSPQLSINTNTLAFGNVPLSSTSTKTLTLTSSGTAPVTVNSATLAGTGFTMTGATFPTNLNPGQTFTLQVTFSPTTAGSASGTITISSNSSSGATATVSLSGTGTTNPVLTLSATTLSFGDDPISTPMTLTVTLSSTGTSPVTVSAAALTGAGFTFSGATFPVTLNPTIAITVQVQFKPAITGAASGTLTFTSNSTTGSTSVVSLTGNGTSVQHQVSLSWTAPVNSPLPVNGYNIYRATGGSSSFQLVNSSSSTAFVDLQVLSSTSYSYYVTSTDSVGTESVPSNQVAVTIP